jgi:hypothetical protein
MEILTANLIYARLELIRFDVELTLDRMKEFHNMHVEIVRMEVVADRITQVMIGLEQKMERDKTRF